MKNIKHVLQDDLHICHVSKAVSQGEQRRSYLLQRARRQKGNS